MHTWHPDTPLEETLAAMDYAVTSGRARYVGISNYTGLADREGRRLAAQRARSGAAGLDPDGVLAARPRR